MTQPIYFGMCVGGPKKGLQIAAYEPTYQLARMQSVPVKRVGGGEDRASWTEVDRGHYEYDSGHWWWKGWALKR